MHVCHPHGPLSIAGGNLPPVANLLQPATPNPRTSRYGVSCQGRADAPPSLAEPFQPRFVMHDYKEQNATFERTRAGWRVSVVFDLMEAFFGDGEVDLARPTVQYTQADPALAAALAGRYRELMPVRPGFGERMKAYLLWDRLVVWEYDQRPKQAGAWTGGADAACLARADPRGVHGSSRRGGSGLSGRANAGAWARLAIGPNGCVSPME